MGNVKHHCINYAELRPKRGNDLKILPCRWLIFSEIMWNMWSMAMLIGCKMSCFGVVYCQFEYGVVKIFAMPRKKKSDYISETQRRAICAKKKQMSDKRKAVVATLGNANIMTLQREAEIQDNLKQYCWMAGASKKL